MGRRFFESGKLRLADAISSDQDSSFKEKPYVRLEEKYDLNPEAVEASASLINSCVEKGVWPVELVVQEFERENLGNVAEYFTDYRDRSRFDPPENLSQLRSEKYAYFAGVAAGDGGFNGSGTWGLVDGGKPEELEDSREFINQFSGLIKSIFGIPERSLCTFERENRIELKIANKWFCRFIRYFFDLPRSYKKGKLVRPEIFNSESLKSVFWRGVFDADGCVSRQSYRISLSSATESFLEQAREDLEARDIRVKEIRKPGAYLLRVSAEDFSRFAEEIGFSHPRKKRILTEKLSKGSRNYKFRGLNEERITESGFFDLTEIEGLRVSGAGKIIEEKREDEGLYQEELAQKLGLSKEQIYSWENNKYAAPVETLKAIYGPKKALFKKLKELEAKFKVGKRGNENSLVKLPLKPTEEVNRIASKCVSTSNELRIRKRSQKVSNRIKKMFEVSVRETESKFVIKNYTVASFFETFYRYEPKFKAYSDKDIEALEGRLSL